MSEAQAKLNKIHEILDKIATELAEAKAILKGETKPPMIPEPYREMVTISDQGDHWQVKPRQFLETSNFAELARIVNGLGGRYVSAGASSHFTIPK